MIINDTIKDKENIYENKYNQFVYGNLYNWYINYGTETVFPMDSKHRRFIRPQ